MLQSFLLICFPTLKCGRTKATAILKVIAHDLWSGIVKALEESSLQTDETTDISVTQQMPIMLRFFDNALGIVRCVFFTLENIERATAEQIFQLIDKHFQQGGSLSYDNLVGLGTDGANVMLGRHNSVMSRLVTQQPHLVAIHCNCHIAALIANASCKVLPGELEDLTTDVWYYFQKSQKRLREFEQFQSFVEVKPHKLLKSCQTRWLSLEACVGRLLCHLILEVQKTEKRWCSELNLPLKSLQLSVALPIVNKFMQQHSSVIHKLQQKLDGFFRKLMLRL